MVVTGMSGACGSGSISGIRQLRPSKRRCGGRLPLVGLSASITRRPWGPDWEFDEIDVNQAVEVWNGPWDRLNPVCVAFWEDQLSRGRRVVAVGGSDTHELRGDGTGLLSPPKLGDPTTWIEVGDRLDTESLLSGLREGRCFVSASPDGPQLYVRRNEDGVRVQVVGANGKMLELICNGEVLSSTMIEADDWTEVFVYPDDAPYLRAQVIDEWDYVWAFANPVWAAM